MSKEFKPQAYNFIRRGWYDQLSALCDSIMSKKGKDPLTAFWKAFTAGMTGSITDCLRQLEAFQSRKDLQFPVTLALIYFHKKATPVDREAVAQLKSELSIAEDVAKEAGLILAARFCLYTENIKEALRISQKVLASKQGSGASTTFEMEATTIVQWCTIAEIEMLGEIDHTSLQQLTAINNLYLNNPNNEQFEPDCYMVWAKSRHLLGRMTDVYNIINQTIAMFPWFLPALADKALLLASDGEWEQALDTAQRLLDVERDHLDALKVIAVHGFTQESHIHDAVQKLEDLDNAVREKEPNSIDTAVELAALFSCICARQPRALQISARLLERAAKHAAEHATDAKCAVLYCQLGNTLVLQGMMQYERAMKAFREATRRDPNNASALLGMILCQCYEGLIEDAESQIELLTVMHTPEDLGYEFAYLQSLLLRSRKDKKKEHLRALTVCRDMFLQHRESNGRKTSAVDVALGVRTYLNAFQGLLAGSPDFTMLLATDFFQHMEATTSIASALPSTNSLLQSGNALKGQLLQQEQAAAVPGAGAGAGAGAGMGMTLVADVGVGGGDAYAPGSPTKGGGGSAGGEGLASGVEITRAVQLGIDLLQLVLRQCPGMVCAYVELARCYAGLGMLDEAGRVLQQGLALQPHSSPVLVAMASVEAGKFSTTAADRVLEQALACDFSIRSAPRFRLVKAIIRAQQGRLDEALVEIEQVLAIPEINFSLPKKDGEPGNGNNNNSAGASYSTKAGLDSAPPIDAQLLSAAGAVYADSLRLTDDDKVGAFVCYSSLLGRSRRMKEANKVLSHAKVLFSGSAQEVQVLVAASQLFVEKGDFDAAIRMLDKITEESPTFARAQLIKADIVLNHNHDKEGFTKCYQQLAEKEPTAKNYALLGEAYLRILNPEAAIDALEQAYKLDPKNGRLRGRIGRALVATHEYHRAVEFYESAIRELNKALNTSQTAGPSGSRGSTELAKKNTSSGNTGAASDLVLLSHDLSKLYIKLGRAESSIRVLKNVLHDPATDVLSLRQDVTTLLLLAQVQRTAAPEDAQASLQRALAVQKELILKLRSSTTAVTSSDVMERERAIVSDISQQLGVLYADSQEARAAEQCFLDAIQQNPQNTKAMLGLAKILYARGEREQCQAQCVKILTAVPTAEEAAIMLSEVLFHSEQPENAVQPLTDLLKLVPNNYLALEKAIGLLRRAGQLEQAEPLLKAAETADRRCQSHAGYHYCQGLHARFTNDIGKAISEFNLARRDGVWGAGALTHMIELYLNPDQEGVWEEKELGPLDEHTRANIAAAEELLRELQQHPGAKDKKRVRVLESYCQLATRNKVSVERAMQSFSEMLDQDQDYLPAVLGMATGFMIEKNQHKARNLLKRVGKMEVSGHDGEDFEKANLLLAKFYIDKSKSDLAQDLCRKTLLENKSCSQAWEILGLIFEKEAKYELAADSYAKAWKLEFEASASVGFKLAFSYLKCRQFVEAIDVCEKVLALYPDYPRISDEILKRAQESIRAAS